MLRAAVNKRYLLDMKNEQMDRIEDHVDDYRKGLVRNRQIVIAALIEQSYDVRMDLNEALLMFCQASFGLGPLVTPLSRLCP